MSVDRILLTVTTLSLLLCLWIVTDMIDRLASILRSQYEREDSKRQETDETEDQL